MDLGRGRMLTSVSWFGYSVHFMNRGDREEAVTLEILQAIEDEEGITQRHLAQRLGVALGLTNSYLKRCARKGLIKVQQAPANRYLYYLTPKGFAEKSRLTAKYLSYSLSFYRKAGASCGRAFDDCVRKGWRSVVLCGVSELAEIAAIKAMEHDIELRGAYDATAQASGFLDKPLWRDLPELGEAHGYVFTGLDDPESNVRALIAAVGAERVVVPDILAVRIDWSDKAGALHKPPFAGA